MGRIPAGSAGGGGGGGTRRALEVTHRSRQPPRPSLLVQERPKAVGAVAIATVVSRP